MEGYQLKGGKEKMGEKVQGLRSKLAGTKLTGGVNNTIGYGEAKELTCTTHGHKLRLGTARGNGGIRQREAKQGKLGQL